MSPYRAHGQRDVMHFVGPIGLAWKREWWQRQAPRHLQNGVQARITMPAMVIADGMRTRKANGGCNTCLATNMSHTDKILHISPR